MNGTILGSIPQSSVRQVLHEDSKRNFLNYGRALFVRYVQKYAEELELAIKQKREPKSTLPVGQRGKPLMLGKIDLIVQNYLRVCYVSINRLIFCP